MLPHMDSNCEDYGLVGNILVTGAGVGIATLSGVAGVAVVGPSRGLLTSGGVMGLLGLILLGIHSPRMGAGLLTMGIASVAAGYALSDHGRKSLAKLVLKSNDLSADRLHAWASRSGSWTERQVEDTIQRAHNLLEPVNPPPAPPNPIAPER